LSFVKHIFNKESPDQIEVGDIQKLIDNEIEESLHLDYEEIPRTNVKYEGLAAHISGFLNTAGGIAIFGVSEKKGKLPHKITWTSITKETLESSLFSKIQPWNEGIKIFPKENPEDNTQRIFIIYVPKSKDPPHMANYRYHIRLNFQTRPLGHEQVSAIFRQNYLLKYDLINNVYSPLLNEFTSFYNQKRIRKWKIAEFEGILRNNTSLLNQDVDFALDLDAFYGRIAKWNKALDVACMQLLKPLNFMVRANTSNTSIYTLKTQVYNKKFERELTQ
jgi:predicted HTH transcriptional regulator